MKSRLSADRGVSEIHPAGEGGARERCISCNFGSSKTYSSALVVESNLFEVGGAANLHPVKICLCVEGRADQCLRRVRAEAQRAFQLHVEEARATIENSCPKEGVAFHVQVLKLDRPVKLCAVAKQISADVGVR